MADFSDVDPELVESLETYHDAHVARTFRAETKRAEFRVLGGLAAFTLEPTDWVRLTFNGTTCDDIEIEPERTIGVLVPNSAYGGLFVTDDTNLSSTSWAGIKINLSSLSPEVTARRTPTSANVDFIVPGRGVLVDVEGNRFRDDRYIFCLPMVCSRIIMNDVQFYPDAEQPAV